MSNNDPKGKPTSEILDMALEALTTHEKRLDKAVQNLATKKVELSENCKRRNTELDDILRSLQKLEDKLKELEATMRK